MSTSSDFASDPIGLLTRILELGNDVDKIGDPNLYHGHPVDCPLEKVPKWHERHIPQEGIHPWWCYCAPLGLSKRNFFDNLKATGCPIGGLGKAKTIRADLFHAYTQGGGRDDEEEGER